MSPTPDELRRAATLLSGRGGHLVDITTTLLRQTEASEWAAPAADRFRQALRLRREVVLHEQAELDQLAARLRRLADDYDARLRECRAIESNVRRWFAAQRPALPTQPPPWLGWRWTPYSRFPSAGGADWLDIRDYFRARGVWV